MEFLTTDLPITIDNVTLIPVVRVCLHSRNKIVCWLSANKRPQAIIVCDKKGIRVFDMCSLEISLESLLESIPDLKNTISPYL